MVKDVLNKKLMAFLYGLMKKLPWLLGTGHIGRAFCEEFAELGGTCLLVDRDGVELEKLMVSLRKINGSTIVISFPI